MEVLLIERKIDIIHIYVKIVVFKKRFAFGRNFFEVGSSFRTLALLFNSLRGIFNFRFAHTIKFYSIREINISSSHRCASLKRSQYKRLPALSLNCFAILNDDRSYVLGLTSLVKRS